MSRESQSEQARAALAELFGNPTDGSECAAPTGAEELTETEAVRPNPGKAVLNQIDLLLEEEELACNGDAAPPSLAPADSDDASAERESGDDPDWLAGFNDMAAAFSVDAADSAGAVEAQSLGEPSPVCEESFDATHVGENVQQARDDDFDFGLFDDAEDDSESDQSLRPLPSNQDTQIQFRLEAADSEFAVMSDQDKTLQTKPESPVEAEADPGDDADAAATINGPLELNEPGAGSPDQAVLTEVEPAAPGRRDGSIERANDASPAQGAVASVTGNSSEPVRGDWNAAPGEIRESLDEARIRTLAAVESVRMDVRLLTERTTETQTQLGDRIAGAEQTLADQLGQVQSTVHMSTQTSAEILRQELTALEDRLLDRFLREIPMSVAHSSASPSEAQTLESLESGGVDHQQEEQGDASWEVLRARLLSGSNPVEETAVAQAEDAADSKAIVEPTTDGAAPQVAVEEPQYAEPIEFRVPEPVDPEILEPDELRGILRRRDDLIQQLAGRLRRVQRMKNTIFSEEQLREVKDGCPEELAGRVDETLRLLNEQLRMGELELSLERARVSRQMVELRASREMLERNAAQLGYEIDENGAIIVQSRRDSGQAAGSSRWMRALGLNKNNP